MKNYQEYDYFCRQTYKLLIASSFNLGIATIVLLLPAINNGICRAKLGVRRKSLNLLSPGANARISKIRRVFAFGIALFASEQ